MNILIGLLIGGLFFIATITAYTLGLKHGKQLSNAVIPQVNINPIKPIVEAIEQKKEEKEAEVLTNIFEYTSETAMQAIKKGV
jgi:dihydropteroate synthase